ncbi:MAG: single-stranded-DNA-specific exonuclease RecJ [Clostridiales bacterium]|nr:single-stranded-DNA-specific exonuclease RecJ [Clostridiales bacterium]
MILLQKKWRLPDETPAFDDMSEKAGESESSLLMRLLHTRGIDPDTFFSGKELEWHDPFLFNDMQIAVDRITSAVNEKEKILICGDYDADGVTATAILMLFFRKLGADIDYVIPNRLSEGYGISDGLLDRIREKKADLLITVDCGVANAESVEQLVNEGMDVIVTDHHEVKEELPPALAVIDAKRTDNTYPFIHLCGAGVALKLVAALEPNFPEKVGKEEWRNYLDIVTIGTIADVVSLTGENRTIVKEGLTALSNTKRPGLRALLSSVKQNANAGSGNAALDMNIPLSVSTGDISFQISPKINACGRLGEADRALELLLTQDPSRAIALTDELISENSRRQELEQSLVDEAVAQIEADQELITNMKNASMPIIVVGENWHLGILGIVANRLVNRYQRTAIVFAEEDGILKGSCRTAGDFPILECLKSCGETVLQYGGHKRAAGVSVEKESFPEFKKRVSAFAEERNTEKDILCTDIDMVITPKDVSLSTAKELAGLEPFGEGNREPVFLLSDLKVLSPKTVGAGNRHLKLVLSYKDEESGNVKNYDAIAFGAGEWADMFAEGSSVDALIEMGINVWNGNESLSLRVADMHFSKIGKIIWDTPEVLENLYRNKLPLKQIALIGKCKEEDLRPTGEEMGILYRHFQQNCKDETNIVDLSLLARLLTGKYRKPLHAFKIARALDIFSEAGLLKMVRINDERICFSLLSVVDRVKLETTKTFQVLFGDMTK